ncbi:hypothetical protein [Kurthia sp. Dielmo]|uniref:hypothetical protein n=1 Tax=Kurthia sp. Dielmo TaxID=1033738 RepID=UPI0011205338|nr:hypothetical protein [Kurthia sp. Dielmo]
MQHDDLLKIENQIRTDMKAQGDLEAFVVLEAKNIGAELAQRKMVRAEVKGTTYEFAFKMVPYKGVRHVYMFVSDLTKRTILREQYKPYGLSAAIDNNETLEANIISMTEAFLRHLLDVIKPEILPDED